MSESWTPAQRARAEQVGRGRLRDMKHELEEEQKRHPNDLNFPVSLEYHNRFSFILDDLRRAGLDIPPMFNSCVDGESTEVSISYMRSRLDDVLGWITSPPTEPHTTP